MSKRFWNNVLKWVSVLAGLWLAWDLLSHLVAEIFWFIEVDYLLVFLKRLQTQLGLWVVVGLISAGFLVGNLLLANRLKYPLEPPPQVKREKRRLPAMLYGEESKPLAPSDQKYPQTTAELRLRSLLPILVLLGLLLGFMLLHYGKIAVNFWQAGWAIPNVKLPLPPSFNRETVQGLVAQLPEQPWQLAVPALTALVLLVNAQFWLSAIAVVLSLFYALVLSGHWLKTLQYFNPTPFGTAEPVFSNDISFYIFRLPVWQLLDFWLGGLYLYALIATGVIYLASGDSLSQGKFAGFSQKQLRHLYGLGAGVAGMVAIRYWLSRFELLYSTRGVTYGASYTDVNVQLPVNTGLSLLSAVFALFLLLKTIVWSPRVRGRTVLAGLTLYVTLAMLLGLFLPDLVQRFGVEPNELERERPYIQRSIALTRAAFDLEEIDARTFVPLSQLTSADLQENDLTIGNIRLWDKRPILQTNRQLQQFRPYYKFVDADIDRYTLRVGASGISPLAEGQQTVRQAKAETDSLLGPPSQPLTERQQTMIAARELEYDAVPEQAQTWVNQHLIYTHGYGFTLSPVNTFAEGGLPAYFVKDIGTGDAIDGEGGLTTSSQLIRDSIPIGTPRIYFGELTDTYVMTNTQVRELDFPSGDENVYNTYNGSGGISIGSLWRRLLFAQYLKDWQMLFTRNFTPETRVLFRREIAQRIRAIAPFLRYDRDPYLVTANAGNPEAGPTENYLYWIVDAYTTSDRYPYSDPGDKEFNYIRNSVKAVIDAYNGKIEFYVADPDDPIIQTWIKIFPNLFKPLAAMPTTLRTHIRYPLDFFGIQSERLLTYHMRDPQVFYNREDLWRIPQEIYGTESQEVEPYYLIIKLPTEANEEFILLHPYTPASRNNLIAWLAGRSDGIHYGKLLLYQFPKQELVYGPEQIEALINQDPVISQQISLWNRQGSRAIQGNLLIIPIEQSLLYVEPLYLEAERNSLPTLVRVIVVYENQIVMARTLEQALQAIFDPDGQETPTIIRPLEEPPLSLEEAPAP